MSKTLSATKIAEDKIKQLIFSGDLAASSNHLETELATRLGMSRTPVREATLTLQAHGLVEVQPRKGVMVKAISIQDITDLFEILTEMECIAVKRATLSGLQPQQLRPLLDIVDKMDEALTNDDRDLWSKIDEDFHIMAVGLSNNVHLEGMVKNIYDQVRRVKLITQHKRPSPTQSSNYHRELCEAMLNGDAKNAQTIHRDHHASTGKILIDLLNNSGLTRV